MAFPFGRFSHGRSLAGKKKRKETWTYTHIWSSAVLSLVFTVTYWPVGLFRTSERRATVGQQSRKAFKARANDCVGKRRRLLGNHYDETQWASRQFHIWRFRHTTTTLVRFPKNTCFSLSLSTNKGHQKPKKSFRFVNDSKTAPAIRRRIRDPSGCSRAALRYCVISRVVATLTPISSGLTR